MNYSRIGFAALGARFGALIGVFAVCGFALHNHMILNIGVKLTVGQASAYFVQWLVVGIGISLIMRQHTRLDSGRYSIQEPRCPRHC